MKPLSSRPCMLLFLSASLCSLIDLVSSQSHGYSLADTTVRAADHKESTARSQPSPAAGAGRPDAKPPMCQGKRWRLSHAERPQTGQGLQTSITRKLKLKANNFVKI